MEVTPKPQKSTRSTRSTASKTTNGPAPKVIINPTEDVINKYIAYGWTVIKPPSGSMNDLITQKGKKLHFVQVIVDANSVRHQGMAKNSFIQNAFSNSAQPIYAHAIYSNKVGEDNKPIHTNVIFEDVNQNTRVIIGAKKATTDTATPAV